MKIAPFLFLVNAREALLHPRLPKLVLHKFSRGTIVFMPDWNARSPRGIGLRKRKERKEQRPQLPVARGWFGKKCRDISFQLRKTKTVFFFFFFNPCYSKNPNPFSSLQFFSWVPTSPKELEIFQFWGYIYPHISALFWFSLLRCSFHVWISSLGKDKMAHIYSLCIGFLSLFFLIWFCYILGFGICFYN